MMVELARQCVYDVRQFGRRVERIARMPLEDTRTESREFDEMEQESARIQAKLMDVVLTVFREEYLRQLCSYEESLDLTTRNQFGSIEEINPEPTFSDLRGKILQSLRYPNQNSRFELISEPSPGTCKWIFDATIGNAKGTFGTWLKANVDTGLDRRFWISGDPGTGKSVLMKYLVMEAQRNPEILKKTESEEAPIVFSHFFNHEGDLIHCTTRGMILNLLVQLFEQDPLLLDARFFIFMTDVMKHQKRKTSAE
ncbi:hypothetical protein SMACR_06871 [Sordaria macrospora]|uniref:WGS project CABT00000000 data, contig 2.38 n=2 Tax=Sordaria macrospora TaxID=5147 RepID=F7W782_SORMK|nr:uncharacterized protein SMAC_06871 [Sordaria macrospora k-hell]KAA8633662.1 hypothetical protein SMACR_06871 [Sordaria macrospora]KAH7634042.1 hypothetical protein B0T09DRAFT_355896 [Sordaria sp. MPI-SDFR-AT-0083]WPJ59604.1 hypothetical protein SMAC4_06871 [Sordaria macrospora]CCC13373.1 unnamed protein product [Sordaria macrospora k-hell]